jgi:hypothetical protein
LLLYKLRDDIDRLVLEAGTKSILHGKRFKYHVFSLFEISLIHFRLLLLVSCVVFLGLLCLSLVLIKQAAKEEEMLLIFHWCLLYQLIYSLQCFGILTGHEMAKQDVKVGLMHI